MIIISRREFTPELLRGTEPVLVPDGLADWPAVHRWSPAYLASTVAHRTVDLSVSATGVIRYSPDGSPLEPANQYVLRDVPFEDATASILGEPSSGKKFYISQKDVLELPELLSDLRFPTHGSETRVNLWFGSAGNVTPLHFDPRNNLFAQIHGSKRFTIFRPEHSRHLYAFPENSHFAHMSYFDPDACSPECHPLAQSAERTTFTITAGQLLFLPAFWWHHVRSTTISISVNQWWPPLRSQCLGPYGASYLSESSAGHVLSQTA